MTRLRALDMARKRWGERVFLRAFTVPGQLRVYEILVAAKPSGVWVLNTTTGRANSDPKCVGRGSSWEGAFAAADRWEAKS